MLEKRAQFIKETLGLEEEKIGELAISAFCREYGAKADRKSNNRFVLDQLEKKYKHSVQVNKFDWCRVADELNHSGGLYALYGRDDTLLYIGKSTDLLLRIPSSIQVLRKEYVPVHSAKYLLVENRGDMDILELLYIQYLKPIHNTDCNHQNSIFEDVAKQFLDLSKFKDIPRK